jgi:hypothetical protein
LIKRIVLGLLTTLCSLLVCLLLLEAGIRLLDNVPLFSFQNFVAKAFDAVRQEGISRYDSKFGWAQESGVAKVQQGGNFTTGEFGVRMPSTVVRPLIQGAVLATGDSLTVGSEVGDEHSWPAQLETMIGTQVINAGNGGYSVDQTVMRTEEMTRRLNPRTALVEVMGITSLYSALRVYGGAPKPYYLIENGNLVLYNEQVPRLPQGESSIGLLRGILGYSYLVQFTMTRLDLLQWWIAAPQRYQWATTPENGLRISCMLMKRLATLRDERNMQVAVVVQYAATEIVSETIGWDRQMLLGCVRERNLTLVDSYDALRAVFKNEGEEGFKRLWVMHDNNRVYGHMSAAGNQLIAKLIAEQVFAKNAKQSQSQ